MVLKSFCETKHRKTHPPPICPRKGYSLGVVGQEYGRSNFCAGVC